MSVIGLQSAIAALIRCPNDNRGSSLRQFLNAYELDEQEYEAALTLAALPELNKYGREQADQRWELIKRSIVRLFHFVEQELLEDLWFYHFEPGAMTVASDHKGRYDYSLAFLHFLQSNAEAQHAIRAASYPFIMDLIAFEQAELELRAALGIAIELHPDSVISNPYLRVLTLHYDIPAVIQGGPQKGQKKLDEPMNLVLVRQAARRDPRLFAVSKELSHFLSSQSSGLPATAVSEDILADLTKMGLLAHTAHDALAASPE